MRYASVVLYVVLVPRWRLPCPTKMVLVKNGDSQCKCPATMYISGCQWQARSGVRREQASRVSLGVMMTRMPPRCRGGQGCRLIANPKFNATRPGLCALRCCCGRCWNCGGGGVYSVVRGIRSTFSMHMRRAGGVRFGCWTCPWGQCGATLLDGSRRCDAAILVVQDLRAK